MYDALFFPLPETCHSATSQSSGLTIVPIVTNIRTIQAPKGFTFSSGLRLPKGTDLAVNYVGMTLDDSIHHKPQTFDGLRSFRNDDPTTSSFTSATSQKSMEWGIGRHSCVGRYFAGFEIKLVLAHLLHGWEIRAPMGKEGAARPTGGDTGGFTGASRERVFRD